MNIPNVKQPHIGRKIERIRELRGMKQETLAANLGITQQAVSKMEQSAEIDEEKLGRIAEVLGVSAEAIKNFNEDAAIYNVLNNYDHTTSNVINYQLSPIERVVELYEQTLKTEREKIGKLETRLARLEAELRRSKNKTSRKK